MGYQDAARRTNPSFSAADNLALPRSGMLAMGHRTDIFGPDAGSPVAVPNAPGIRSAIVSTTDQIDHATRFGERRVAERDKARLVRNVFDSVASRYDLMNDLMSAGVHRLWKREMATLLARDVGRGRVVDVAGGTGDIAFRLLRHGFSVDIVDINASMLSVGRNRAAASGITGELRWVCGDAEALPLPAGSADAYSVAFGIRNMTRLDRVLAEARRVLRPGGRFACLEFGHAVLPVLPAIQERYMAAVLPRLGALVTGDRESYQYLAESIRRFPEQGRFAAMVADAGLARVATTNLSGGIAALTTAWRL